MEYKVKKDILENIDKIHTTELGILRISKNLSLENEDPVNFCKEIIKNSSSNATRLGKNYYINFNDIKITVNAKSFTIITAHKK